MGKRIGYASANAEHKKRLAQKILGMEKQKVVGASPQSKKNLARPRTECLIPKNIKYGQKWLVGVPRIALKKTRSITLIKE
jgi:hypothetical protein